MSVESTSSEVDAGFHYVVLVDPDTLDTVAEADVAVAGGRYAFSLQDVPAGSYLLYAGSDLDNDFLICDGGEACGAWPTLGSPEVLDVTSDLSGLDFVTGFQQSVGTSAASPGGSPADAGLRRLRLRSLGR
jgi:serine protease